MTGASGIILVISGTGISSCSMIGVSVAVGSLISNSDDSGRVRSTSGNIDSKSGSIVSDSGTSIGVATGASASAIISAACGI